MLKSVAVLAFAAALLTTSACGPKPPGRGGPPNVGPAELRRITITCNVWDQYGKTQGWPVLAEATALIINGEEVSSVDEYPYRKNVQTPYSDVAEISPGVVVEITLTCSSPGLFAGWRIECQTFINGVKDVSEHDQRGPFRGENKVDLQTVACQYRG